VHGVRREGEPTPAPNPGYPDSPMSTPPRRLRRTVRSDD
jgi:hypothetical protein